MDHRYATDNRKGILPRPRVGPLPPLLPCPVGPHLMGRRLAGHCHADPRPSNVVDAIHDLCRLSLDSQISTLISSPPVVEDSNATQVRVLDNRFVESLLELDGMQSVAHKMKEDMMSTIGRLN
eukprot:TRINITY_DN11835_c2_g1_i5.p1 TRINITY_DN11835_c2_g1~~TRINITY_DN11835_c2_g1_i5.p1  ORF type:complete len:123 (+),score=16.39 TRINITY_DN11835_c2_g1_i5:598-966(+)